METYDCSVGFPEAYSFYPTYEEWKRTDKKMEFMGRILFILPMRNGNQISQPCLSCPSPPFYPTYEEWKPLPFLKFNSIFLTFYPTYEEWKLQTFNFFLFSYYFLSYL